VFSYSHLEINHDREPIRLFESDLVEFFTHIHPAVVALIWTPVVLFFLGSAIWRVVRQPGARAGYIVVGIVCGLLLWTLAEYTLHRFVFHFRPRTARQARIVYLFHGIHHHQPRCKTRLVMPPVVSVPLALLFYGGFYLILSVALGRPQWIAPTYAGFIAGYLSYDMIHYATHHIPMRRVPGKVLKRYHLQHHYKTPEQRFGVSSPLWDTVFGTKPDGR
jgi:sterol desaturase/sphingolipid hydroxylase (fatty acid hydroxylase superfamily)